MFAFLFRLIIAMHHTTLQTYGVSAMIKQIKFERGWQPEDSLVIGGFVVSR